MIQLIFCAFLIFCNGFFVAAEYALLNVRRTQLEVLRDSGNRRARLVLEIKDNINSYLTADQVGITLASLGIGALAEPAINEYFTRFLEWAQIPMSVSMASTLSYIIALTAASFLHILLGELAPKSLALEKTLGVAMAIARPMWIFHLLIKPIIWLLNESSNLLLRLLHINVSPEGHIDSYSAEELRNIAQQSSNDGTISKAQGTLLDNVFEFSEFNAREIMIPRNQVDAVSIDDSVDDFMKMALAKGHSRYPVYREDLDDIAGIVHIKDIMSAREAGKKDVRLADILREVVYIPETANISNVLRKLQAKRAHLAVVVDEYGGTSGILAIEDALERLVGEIGDEFDPETQNNIEPHDGGWLVRGETLLMELTEMVEANEIEAESDTVSGFIMEKLGRVAHLHDSIDYQDLSYEVIAMERLRISKVFVKKREIPDELEKDQDD